MSMSDEPAPVDTSQQTTPTLDSSPNNSLRPAPPLWGLRDLALFLAFVPAALFVSNVVVVTGYLALRPFLGWRLPLQALEQNPFLLLTVQSVFHGLLFAYIYFLIAAYHRRPFWAALNWRNPTGRESIRFLTGGIFLAVLVRFAPTVLPEKGPFPLERFFNSPRTAYAIAAFAVFVAPLMEEIVFRGVLFAIFERQAGLWLAVPVTAALFAALHVPEYWGAWNHVLLIFVVGLVFSLARGLTGSLAPSVMLHSTYNATLMLGFFLETHEFRQLQTWLPR